MNWKVDVISKKSPAKPKVKHRSKNSKIMKAIKINGQVHEYHATKGWRVYRDNEI